MNAENTQPTSPPVYLWVMIPTGIAGVTSDISEAFATVDRAMEQHADAQAWAIFKASTMQEWPYVRLIPDGAESRAIHEWIKANIARAQLKKAQRDERRRAAAEGARRDSV